MTKKTDNKRNASRPLGLFGWIKARIIERRLRRRWKNDPEYRERVRLAVSGRVENHKFTANAKPKFNKGVCVNE